MGRNDRGVTAPDQDFSAWYNEVVVQAELVDRGPVKGTMVSGPTATESGSCCRPRWIARSKRPATRTPTSRCFPSSYLSREAEHVEGFAPELAIVTHAGGKELEEPLVVRPTSKTIIGEMMSKWISSHRDLPLLLNQWSNVVRWEMRPRMFLRTTEFLWQEGHTAHADEAEAVAEMVTTLNLYAEVSTKFAAMPVIPGEKTAGERFAGAVRTTTIESMMRDGKALQAGTSHYLGQNFGRAFNIRYTSVEDDLVFAHTTSFGMSTRMIGGIVRTHGDERGLVLPPKLAPYQVVIVPIGRGKQKIAVDAAAAKLADQLRCAGIRIHLDDRSQLSPGVQVPPVGASGRTDPSRTRSARPRGQRRDDGVARRRGQAADQPGQRGLHRGRHPGRVSGHVVTPGDRVPGLPHPGDR